MFIDKLDDIVDKYHSIFHSSIKMKPVDVNASTYVGSNKKINKQDTKFKVREKHSCKRLLSELV